MYLGDRWAPFTLSEGVLPEIVMREGRERADDEQNDLFVECAAK